MGEWARTGLLRAALGAGGRLRIVHWNQLPPLHWSVAEITFYDTFKVRQRLRQADAKHSIWIFILIGNKTKILQ